MPHHHLTACATFMGPIAAAIAGSLFALGGCQLDPSASQSASITPAEAVSAPSPEPSPASRDLPRTGDAAERWTRSAAMNDCVVGLITRWRSLPRSADAAERWLETC